MRLGLDRLFKEEKHLIKGKRLGILAHQASLNSKSAHIIDLLTKEKKEWQVTTLFGPEHGLTTIAQDMEAVGEQVHKPTGLPVHSLYGNSEKSLKPTAEMLKNIDTLVIDLQDVGSRYYTYVWTALLCIEVAAKCKKNVIVLDRPNPINGLDIEGEPNHKGYTSFVGLYPLPVRHGLTIGELTRFINDTQDLNCDLTIVPMEGWKREWYWDETGIQWTHPSPNMRSLKQAILYPGACLIEATNISEGRGTDTPFEILGAPFIEPKELIELLKNRTLTGIQFESVTFTPTFQKWAGQKCHGLRLEITNRQAFKSYETGLAILWALHTLYHEKGFEWRKEAYEFIDDTPAIDLLTGSAICRQGLEKHLPLNLICEWVAHPPESFNRQRAPYLLY